MTIAAPALTTLVALGPRHVGVGTAALMFVLAVAGVSAFGGLAAGLAASLLSFGSLHYFFTPPRGVLALPRPEDLMALLVFLVVSIVIGVMLATVVARGSAAERKARETQVLHDVATQLMRGEAIEPVLGGFARSVVELLGLARLEASTVYTPDVVAAGPSVPADGHSERFSMLVRGRSVGELRAAPADHAGLGREEREALTMFADQLALALDAVGLAAQAHGAELDADASRARAALFSSVTHDLRSPLASILASATTLRADVELAPQDRAELLDAICHETARLNRLVGNILHLSRMRAGALTPTKVKVPIDELVFGVLGHMEHTLASFDVDVRIDPDLPEVPMDVVQLDQVLTNLLENAALFAEGSPIRLAATGSDGFIRLCVSDGGPGIPPRERERVFEPFVRLGGPQGSIGDPGAGLGLAICRAIVEAHGGTIRIGETEPRGTTVIVDLPLEQP